MKCKICGSSQIIPLLYVENSPVANNVICKTPAEASTFPTGTLELVSCRSCGFSWNKAYSSSLLSYVSSYENNQSHSPLFVEHLREVIGHISDTLRGSHLVEIGCGQGYFLSMLAEAAGDRLGFAMGFDPALRGHAVHPTHELHASVMTSALFRPDFCPSHVVSRHVIEHIQEPLNFVEDICQQIPGMEFFFVETPSLEWIIENKAYYDIYYEHCSLFSEKALHLLLEKSGLNVVSMKRMFGGQYQLGTASRSAVPASPPPLKIDVANFKLGIKDFEARWTAKIETLLTTYGNLAIWGAASKGITFLQRLGTVGRSIDCVIDINPLKCGGYVPQTGTPVVSPEEAFAKDVRACIVANPLYLDEVKKYCQSRNVTMPLFPLV